MNEYKSAPSEKEKVVLPRTAEEVEEDKQILVQWMKENTKSGRTAREILTCAFTENGGFFSIFSRLQRSSNSSQSTNSLRKNTKTANMALKVTILVGLLLTLAIRSYSSSKDRRRLDAAVVSPELEAETRVYFELDLPPGPSHLLQNLLARLEEKSANHASDMSEIEKKRLLFLQDLKAKGRL